MDLKTRKASDKKPGEARCFSGSSVVMEAMRKAVEKARFVR
ncbi:hypothetical protein ACLB1M_29025 [Escherichia coli]